MPLTSTGMQIGVAVPPGEASQVIAGLVQPVSEQNPPSGIIIMSVIVMHSAGTTPQSIATVHAEYIPSAGCVPSPPPPLLSPSLLPELSPGRPVLLSAAPPLLSGAPSLLPDALDSPVSLEPLSSVDAVVTGTVVTLVDGVEVAPNGSLSPPATVHAANAIALVAPKLRSIPMVTPG